MKTIVHSPFRAFGLLLAVATAILASATTAQAQTKTWNGTSNGTWNTAGNWSPSGAPATTDAVVFDNVGTFLNLSTGGQRTVTSLTFTANQTSTVTIATTTTNWLGLSSSTTPIVVDAGTHVISGNGTSGSGAAWDVRLIGSDTGNRTISVTTGASLEIQGRFVSANAAGTSRVDRSLIKTGNGTLILSGQNGGSGGFQVSGSNAFSINAGTLQLANTNAFGNSGNNYSVANGAAIELAGGFSQTLNDGTTSGTITLRGTGISGAGALRSISGNNTLGGNSTVGVSLAANSSIGVDAGQLVLNIPVTSASGTRSLTKVGVGTLALSASGNFTGGTNISAGTLSFANGALGSTGNITFTGNSRLQWASGNTQDVSSRIVMTDGVASTFDTNSNNVTFAAGIGSASSGSLTKAGLGTLTLAAANTYTGNTTISAGTLVLGASGSLASSLIDVQAGATFDPSAVSGGFALASGQALSIASTGTVLGDIDVANGTTFVIGSGNGTKTIAGNLAFGESSTWDVSSVIAGGTGITNDSNLFNVTFGSGFGVANLLGVDALTPIGTYTLISSNQTFSSSGIGNWGSGAQASIGGGKFAYFQQGSLQLVVVPEPSTFALAAIGIAGLGYVASRRRQR